MDTIAIADPSLGLYVQTPISVIRHRGLSLGARLLWADLLSYGFSKALAWPGQELLAEDLGADVRTIRRWLHELVTARLVTVTPHGHKTARGSSSNLYSIYSPHHLAPSDPDQLPADTQIETRTPVSSPRRTPVSSPRRTPVSSERDEGKREEIEREKSPEIGPASTRAHTKPAPSPAEPTGEAIAIADTIRRLDPAFGDPLDLEILDQALQTYPDQDGRTAANRYVKWQMGELGKRSRHQTAVVLEDHARGFLRQLQVASERNMFPRPRALSLATPPHHPTERPAGPPPPPVQHWQMPQQPTHADRVFSYLLHLADRKYGSQQAALWLGSTVPSIDGDQLQLEIGDEFGREFTRQMLLPMLNSFAHQLHQDGFVEDRYTVTVVSPPRQQQSA